MAINIVQVAGTVNSSTTLYTVPAGRTAKVIVTYVKTGNNGNFLRSNGNNLLGGPDDIIFGATVTFNTGSPFAAAGGNQIIGVGSASTTVYVGPATWYMGPGQTITSSISGGTMTYDLQVIEQF